MAHSMPPIATFLPPPSTYSVLATTATYRDKECANSRCEALQYRYINSRYEALHCRYITFTLLHAARRYIAVTIPLHYFTLQGRYIAVTLLLHYLTLRGVTLPLHYLYITSRC